MFDPSWPPIAKKETIGGRVGMTLLHISAPEQALGKADLPKEVTSGLKKKFVWITPAFRLVPYIRRDALHVFGPRLRQARRRAAQ